MQESLTERRIRERAAANLAVIISAVAVVGAAMMFGWNLGCREYFRREDSNQSTSYKSLQLTDSDIQFINESYRVKEDVSYSTGLGR